MKSNFVLALSVMSILAYSPEQVLAKNISISQQQMDQYQAIESMNSKLSPHDDTMKSLMLTQDQKNAVLKNIDKVLKEKNETIFEYMKLNKKLQSKLNKVSLKERISTEMKKRQLSDSIESSEDSIASLKGVIVEKDLKIQYLQKLLKNQNTQLASEVKKLNFKIKMMSRKYASSSHTVDTNQFKIESKHHEVLRAYQNKLFENQKTIAAFKKKFEKNNNYKALIAENSKLASGLRSSQVELQNYKEAYHKMENKYLAKVKEYKKLEVFTNNMQNEFNEQLSDLKGKYVQALAANSRPIQAGRKPASTSIEMTETSSNIKEELNTEGLGHLIELDPERLKITLDETLLFKRGNTQLDPDSAEKIRRILTVYSKEIFSKEKLKERLLKVQVVGHSSPIYKSKFIEPMEASKEAYDANLDVSIARAKSLVEVIFSDNFGDFPHKQEIRSKIVISGKSFSDPKPLMRGPAAVSTIACGQYDCEGSQRVEILFEFEKEN